MGIRFFYNFLFVLIIIISNATSDFSYDEDVLVLSKVDFKKAVNDIEHLLVEFCKYKVVCFASWMWYIFIFFLLILPTCGCSF